MRNWVSIGASRLDWRLRVDLSDCACLWPWSSCSGELWGGGWVMRTCNDMRAKHLVPSQCLWRRSRARCWWWSEMCGGAKLWTRSSRGWGLCIEWQRMCRGHELRTDHLIYWDSLTALIKLFTECSCEDVKETLGVSRLLLHFSLSVERLDEVETFDLAHLSLAEWAV